MTKNKEFKPQFKGDRLLIKVRLSYVHLDSPWSGNENNEKKYSVSCIVPKEDEATLEAVKKAIEMAKEAGKSSKWGGIIPKKLQTPLRDGDEERDDPAYSDSYFFNATSKQPVRTFNRGAEPCAPTDIYSGSWGIVSLRFYPYDASGNKGIAAGLNQVLKWADDEPLGNSNQGNDFEGIEGLELGGEGLDEL